MSKHSLIYKLLVLCLPCSGFADSTHYYNDAVRDEEISSEDETLLVFPSPPLAAVCQPTGVVELNLANSIDNISKSKPSFGDLDAATCAAKGTCKTTSRDTALARMLSAVPKDPYKTKTTCSFRLSNNESFSVNFLLKTNMHKPKVEFKNLFENQDTSGEVTKSLGGMNVFRSLLNGENPTYLVDLTKIVVNGDGPATRGTLRTKNSTYKLTYHGTDKTRFSAWRYKVSGKFPFEPLTSKKIGLLLYSAFVESKHELVLLTRHDVSAREIEALLP